MNRYQFHVIKTENDINNALEKTYSPKKNPERLMKYIRLTEVYLLSFVMFKVIINF